MDPGAIHLLKWVIKLVKTITLFIEQKLLTSSHILYLSVTSMKEGDDLC